MPGAEASRSYIGRRYGAGMFVTIATRTRDAKPVAGAAVDRIDSLAVSIG